ncbi:unnamed protein product [Cunninghamella echinulata]
MEKENNQQTSDSSVTTTKSDENKNIIIEDEKVETTADLVKEAEKIDERSDKQKKIARVMTFVALQVALFLGALDGTIVSTCLPRIGSDFNQMSIVSWVATAYILTFDSFQPLFSKFSDIFGRKWTLITGIGIFLFGSLLCGVANSMIMLIISRSIAGVGAAGIFTGVFITISEIVPLEKRGSYQGIINAVFAMSSVFGPLGGFADHVTWRWNFYINLPIGGVAIVLLIFFLNLPTKKTTFMDKLKRIDYLGTLIILLAAILFLLALNFGGELFPWGSAAVIVPLVFSFVFAGLLAFVESKFAKEPILPPRLFKNRSILAIIITNWWFGLTFFSLMYYLPIYFQIVKGDTAMWSGIRLIPLQLVICVVSVSTGLAITRFQLYRPFIWIGTSIITLSVGLISLFDVDTDFSMIYGITVLSGVGMGMIFSSTIIAIQASAEPKDIAVVTGLGNFTRLLGAAVGVAISGSILNSGLSQNLPTVLPQEYADMVMKSSLFVNDGLPEQYKAATLQVYCDSIRLIWYVITPLIGMGVVSSAFIKHYNLRKPGQRGNKDAASPKEDTNQQQSGDKLDKDDIVIDVSESDTGDQNKKNENQVNGDSNKILTEDQKKPAEVK